MQNTLFTGKGKASARMKLKSDEIIIVEKFVKDIEYFQYDFSFDDKFNDLFPKGGETPDEHKNRKDYLYGLVAHKARVIHMAYTPGFPPNTRYTISEKGELVRDFKGGYKEWEKFNEERINYIRNYRQNEIDHFTGEKSQRRWSIGNMIVTALFAAISTTYIVKSHYREINSVSLQSQESEIQKKQIQELIKSISKLQQAHPAKIGITDTVLIRNIFEKADSLSK